MTTKTNTILNGIMSNAVSYIDTQETYMAVSTDTTAPTVSDTTLGGTELRQAVLSSSTTSNSITKEVFISASQFNGNTINKAGTYSASSGANLLGASLTNSIVKNATTEVFVSITTTVSVVNV